ncbi:MAG: creatininase family protein [Chloroflexota bacterium]|nr:MAG: creatininase family protein [Chloroflexota bacterium]
MRTARMNKISALRELTTAQVARLEPAQWLVVWPVASLEQHGPHLPLGTDAIVLEAIVERVRERLGAGFQALFLPMMHLGKSPEHLTFPGTVSLQASTLLAVVDDLVASLAAHQFRRFVFLNGHGGNTALLQAVGPDLRYRYGVRVYYLDLWASSFFDDIIAELFPSLVGREVHAASVETSLLLHLRPELVDQMPDTSTLRAAADQESVNLTGTVPFGWLARDFGTSGVIGDPSLASAEAGEQILAYAVERACRMLQEIYDMHEGD